MLVSQQPNKHLSAELAREAPAATSALQICSSAMSHAETQALEATGEQLHQQLSCITMPQDARCILKDMMRLPHKRGLSPSSYIYHYGGCGVAMLPTQHMGTRMHSCGAQCLTLHNNMAAGP